MRPHPRISIGIGIAMIALAAYVLIASLWTGRPVTSSRLLDVGFALFFAARGALALRRARR